MPTPTRPAMVALAHYRAGTRARRAVAALVIALAMPLQARLEAQATRTRIVFRHLTPAEGLSQADVGVIAQDSLGFMWFGTEDGLDRYDGHVVRVFKPLAFDTTSLSHPWIYGLAPTRGSGLWVATEAGGLDRYDAATESFSHVRFPPGSSRDLFSLLRARDGSLWIGTRYAGLIHYDPASGRVATYRSGSAEGPSENRITTLLEDRLGRIWVGTNAGGLDRLDPRTGAWSHFHHDPGDPSSLPHGTVAALLEDHAGHVWVGTSPGGLSRFRAGDGSFANYPSNPRDTGSIGGRGVHSLLEDPLGQLWVGTDAGLDRLDPASGRVAHFRHDPADAGSILGGAVLSLYLDRSGVLWAGTERGVSYFEWDAPPFRRIAADSADPRSLDDPDIWAIHEDRRGTLWVGSAGGLNRVDPGGRVTRYPTGGTAPGSLSGGIVMGIQEDRGGALWIGTRHGALQRFDPATGRVVERFSHDPADSSSLLTDTPWKIFEDRQGRFWVTNGGEGCLNRMDRATRTFRHFCHDPANPNTPAYDIAHDIVQDASGALWLGTWGGGLDRFDPDAGTFTHFRHDPTDPNSPASDFIIALHQDRHGILWLGLFGYGLDRFDPRTGTFTHYTQANSALPNDIVLAIEEDHSGALWLSTYRGLARFTPATGRFRSYGVEDGLQALEFNSAASSQAPDGELFFGGINGVNRFYPDSIRDSPVAPAVVLTGLRIRGRATAVGGDSPLRAALPFTHTLELRSDQRDIEIRFAALHFVAPEGNRFRYRLEGYDTQWHTPGPEPVATYTNLDPGRYTFQVRASNSDGVWNERGASLAIVILPPWWRTWWAYAIALTSVLGLLYSLRSYELNRMRLKSSLAVEQAEKQHLRELEDARSRFFANVSHEFRTPLTLTLGPLDDIRAGLHGPLTPAMTEQVDLARRNAGRVLDLINQILELSRLEAGRTRLRARRLDLASFVRDLAATFLPLAERKAITLDVNAPADPVAVYADPAHLEKAVDNLLSNAVKFTPPGGTVRVTVEADADARIVVRDSGPGIPAAEVSRIFQRFHRVENDVTAGQPGTGIGLALARELVQLHGGSLGAESEEGFGSTFTIRLPLGHAHLAPDQIVPDDDGAPAAATAPPAQQAVAEPAARDLEPPETAEQADVTTILVVEDNAEVRAYIRRHLAPHYRVVEAEDGRHGLETARSLLPDLVLADVMMPGLDGYAVCRAIKQDPDTDFIPVILLTARAAPEDRLEGLQERADDYLTKPFDVSELLARVDNLITSRKLLRDRFGATRLEIHAAAIDIVPADERFLEQVRAAIEENLGDESFTVERLASAVAHSRGHLHRRLRELLDETPSDLIRRMRLERAAQLIEAGAGSVATIAYAVGFKSVSHFSNRFNEHFGVRPSSYRAQSAH